MSAWREIAEKVAPYAPALGAALGGPGGAAAGRLLAAGLGVAATPADVDGALATDPEAIVKLRGIEAGLETVLIEQRGQAVAAEAKSESWLARNWRPLTMLSFVGLVGAYWLGIAQPDLPESAVLAVLDIVQVGLGGYVIGRSAEKITRTASGAGIFDHLAARRRE